MKTQFRIFNSLFTRLGITTAVALTLSACILDDSTTPATPTCTPLPVVKIQLFGDSTQVGHGGGGITPTKVVQAYMDKAFGTGKVAVTLRGVSGMTTANLIAGNDGLNAPWPGSVNANIAVVNYGLNDKRLISLEAYRTNLVKLAVAKPGTAMVFETPNVTTAWGDISPWVQAMREVAVANKLPVADTYTYTLTRAGMIPDGVHPGGALYQLIGDNVLAPTLAPMVAKLLCQK